MGCRSCKAKPAHVLPSLEFFLKYEIGMKLGSGASSQVYEVMCKASEKDFAAKCIVKEHALQEDQRHIDLSREISIMNMLEHDNICKFYEVFEDEAIVYYVLELAEGETLFEKLEA